MFKQPTIDEKWDEFSKDKAINEGNTTGYDCFLAGYAIAHRDALEMFQAIELRRGKSVAPSLVKYVTEIANLRNALKYALEYLGDERPFICNLIAQGHTEEEAHIIFNS